MKRLTSKSISKAINEKYEIEGVMVHCAEGCCHWYSDTNEEAASVIHAGNNGVEVCRINHLTLEQWLQEFIRMWNTNAPKRLRIQE